MGGVGGGNLKSSENAYSGGIRMKLSGKNKCKS